MAKRARAARPPQGQRREPPLDRARFESAFEDRYGLHPDAREVLVTASQGAVEHGREIQRHLRGAAELQRKLLRCERELARWGEVRAHGTRGRKVRDLPAVLRTGARPGSTVGYSHALASERPEERAVREGIRNIVADACGALIEGAMKIGNIVDRADPSGTVRRSSRGAAPDLALDRACYEAAMLLRDRHPEGRIDWTDVRDLLRYHDHDFGRAPSRERALAQRARVHARRHGLTL
jgi:hypothetical protein